MTQHVEPSVSSDTSGTNPEAPFQSSLREGRQRFLAHVIVHGLDVGRRSPADFVRHFDPESIMQGLGGTPELRAAILSPSTGIKPKIALRKSWQSAADDLQIALDVGATNAREIVLAFAPDDRVRYLDAERLWAYVVEGEFWKTPSGDAQGVAKSHVAFMLSQALRDDLLTHRDMVEGVTVSELASKLPRGELGHIIESALDRGHRALPYTEKELLDDMPPERMVEHVPLPHVWENVVRARIADPHGYTGQPVAETSVEVEVALVDPPAEAAAPDEQAQTEAPPANESVERGWSNVPPAEVEMRKSSKRQSKRPRGAG